MMKLFTFFDFLRVKVLLIFWRGRLVYELRYNVMLINLPVGCWQYCGELFS